MNIFQAKEEIANTVKAYFLKDEQGNPKIPELRQRPVLLMGPPGVGKTQIMQQISEELNIGLVSYTITHHTRQSAVGLPIVSKKVYDGVERDVTEYTMSEIISGIYEYMEKTGHKKGILFIDEINCVSETLMPMMLQFLQVKTFGNQKLPKNWIIVAAGNPSEYNKQVRELDVVTLDRVRLINVEPDLDAWKIYAINRKVHRSILSYLDVKADNFYKVYSDVDGLKFVTARGWEDLSTLLYSYEELGIAITEDIIYEYLRDREVAEDFLSFYDLYMKYSKDYEIELILKASVDAAVYARLNNAEYDEKLILINLLLERLDRDFKEANESAEELKKAKDSGTDYDMSLELKVGVSSEMASSNLDNTIRFIKEGLDEGSMLIFITNLTLSENAAIFLLNNPNKNYLEYADKLLINSKKTKILKDLNKQNGVN